LPAPFDVDLCTLQPPEGISVDRSDTPIVYLFMENMENAKLYEFSTKGGPSARGLIGALVPLFIVATGFWFWTAAAAFADDKSSRGKDQSLSHVEGEKTKNSNATDKCTVCHNPHNFHEISIPCDQVDKFLNNHPGDFRGRCTVTPHTSR